jgi:hypothetical protein
MTPNAPNSGSPPSARAAELCRFFTLSEEGKALLTPEAMPDQFAETLMKAERYPDAVQVIAHHLPKRQGVFWAMTCVRQSGDALTPEMEAALKSAEKWIADPSEENRRATLPAAEAAETGTPAGCTALAAYYSDGLPRTEDPKANARAHFMTAKLVGSAVLLSAASDPQQMQARFGSFTAKGLEIVRKSRR